MEESGVDIRNILRLVFIASLASLSYEIALLRIFSISLSYHFAFMVISIAMLGIGASGSVLSIFRGLKDVRRMPHYVFALAITIPISYLLANAVPFDPVRLSWDWWQLLAISLYYVILCVPFFCFGLIVATSYTVLSREATAVYAADLLGAGAGALVIAWLLSLDGPEMSVFIISTLLATGLLHEFTWKWRVAPIFLVATNLAILFVHPAFINPRLSPYKPFALAMQYPAAEHLGVAYSTYARVDLFKSPAARFAPGLSLTYLEPLPEQTGLAVDAGDLFAITNDSDADKLAFVKALPSSLAYQLSLDDEVLIVEPHAGLALLTATQFRARNVSAIDSNPLVLHVMREYGRMRGWQVYEHQAWSGLARTWLLTSNTKFDLIDLSFTGALPSATFGFAEDYRYTVEAFRQYLSHLKHDGFLSLSLYITPPLRTELRLLATLARAAEAEGVRDVSEHVAAIRSWDAVTIIMKKTPLTPEDIRQIKSFAGKNRFDLAYYPGITPAESNVHIKMPDNRYAESFHLVLTSETRSRFIEDYLFDVQPVGDDKPFFHYYLKTKNIKAIFQIMGGKWQYFVDEGYLLPIVFCQVLVVSAALILLPLMALKKAEATSRERSPLRFLSYFALLGLGYLFIEIAFIQKMILVLENPSSAASTVIASVLISSGMGSLLSNRFKALRTPYVILVLAGLVFLYGYLLPAIIGPMSQHSMTIKIMLSFLIVMPAGILMGIPFPLGISSLGLSAPALIPWAWAVNGCFAVLAPVIATMVALSVGFQAVLFAGAAVYAAAFWTLGGTGCEHWK